MRACRGEASAPLGRRGPVVAIAAALLALAVAAITGCGGATADTPAPTRVTIVTPGTGNDVDWTTTAWAGFQAMLEQQRHVTGQIADASHVAHVARALDALAKSSDLVIAHDTAYAKAAAAVAARTHVPVLVWRDRAALRPGLVGDVEVDGAAAGYVAGVVAAKTVGSHPLGVLIARGGVAADLRIWHELAGGFVSGARSVGADVRLAYAQAGPHEAATPADVALATRRLAHQGAQSIFALGRRSAAASLDASARLAGDQAHYYVSPIGVKASSEHRDLAVEGIAWNFQAVFAHALRDLRAGRFGRRPYVLSLANGGLSLATTGSVPQDVADDADRLRHAIERGQVQVPRTRSEAQLRALVRRG